MIDTNGIVRVPITMSELPRDMGVPERVIAVLPWNTSVRSIASPLGYAVNILLSMINLGKDAGIID